MPKRRTPRSLVADVAMQASRGPGLLEPLVATVRVVARVKPVKPSAFRKAAAGCPPLDGELERLLKAYSPSENAALAGALVASVKEVLPARRRRGGQYVIPVPEEAEAVAKLWGHRVMVAREQSGTADADAAKAVKARAIAKVAKLLLLPRGADDKARRDRASELVDLYAKPDRGGQKG